VRIKF